MPRKPPQRSPGAPGKYSRKPVRKGRYSAGKKPSPIAAPAGLFLPDKEMLVRLIASKGASDAEIEQVYACPPGSIAKWREMYPSFAKALESGRANVDGDVMYAFYKNCVGFDYTEEQAVGGKIPTKLTVRRYKTPDFAAQKFWLQNRQQWKSVEGREHSTPNGPLGIKVESRNEIIDSILTLVKPKPDQEEARPEDKRK